MRKAGRKKPGAGKKTSGMRARAQKPIGAAGQPASAFSRLQSWFPYLVVLACCLLYAFQLGINQPYFSYQVAGQQTVTYGSCTAASAASQAFSSGAGALMLLPDGADSSSFASFSGSGTATEVRLARLSSSTLGISRLVINGEEICSPCDIGRKYPVASGSGNLEVMVDATAHPMEAPAAVGGAFFEETLPSSIEAPLELGFGGSWRSSKNAAMPSSFYGTDAPFHINRLKEFSESIRSLRMPRLDYPLLSTLPAAALYLAGAAPYQYAYKMYEILLFFVPVALFLLFSRKLPVWGAWAFLFASLIYLYLPATGYPTGGGADLFMYGMTAQSLATYLSLAFFLFAHEFLFEKNGGSLKYAVLLFFLATAANPRILFPLCLLFAVLFAAALPTRNARRAALLAAACAASAAWLVAGFLRSFNISTYGALVGASITGAEQGIVAFVQAGYYVLPLLFVIGWHAAYRKKNSFAVLLGFWAAAVLLCATSPGLNRLFPFIDGLRLLPSFFLPVFFIAGFGAAGLAALLTANAPAIGKRLGVDRDTFAVSVALALFIPLSLLLLSAMISTTDQYAGEGNSLYAASEYTWLQKAYAAAGAGSVVYVNRGYVSQYPIYEARLDDTVSSDYAGADMLYRKAVDYGASGIILGNYWDLHSPQEQTLAQAYLEMKNDPRFYEKVGFGAGRMFGLAACPQPGNAALPLPAKKSLRFDPFEMLLCAAALAACAFAARRA